MKNKKKNKEKSKIAKIIDNINNHNLVINCELWIGNNDFYLIPSIYFSKGYYFEIVFVIFNIVLDIGFKIKNNDGKSE